jgi:hypothetical protein
MTIGAPPAIDRQVDLAAGLLAPSAVAGQSIYGRYCAS